MSNEKKIVDRAGIGDDQHRSESQPPQVLALTLKVFDRVVGPDLMSFQESVELITSGESQKSTHVGLADVAAQRRRREYALLRPYHSTLV
jgi:hypothetical protein